MTLEALSSEVGFLHQGHLSASHSEFGKEAQGKIFISQLCVKEIETKASSSQDDLLEVKHKAWYKRVLHITTKQQIQVGVLHLCR